MKKAFFICLYLLLALAPAAQQKRPVYVVYIGNSITQGALIDAPEHNAPPAQASRYLSGQKDIDLRGFSNQGVSGQTTVDFLPAQQTRFPKVVAAAAPFAADSGAILLFSVMLGTNDSAIRGPNGAPVSPVQYYTNLKVLLDELFRLYPEAVFVLQRPVWYSPNTYNSAMYLKAGLERLVSYAPELERLEETYARLRPGRVFTGDTAAFDYFRTHYATDLVPEDGNAGTFYLHPNAAGAARLGEFWGRAIHRVIGQLP
ncbi:MAG: GDSL-type esterase/lipase family protein [Tannerella sp.]|jgi:lysophospholipase L1-like esterase|nr:GDSL-type esterase/lipase family protein [Tannerella sp.]